MDLHDTIEHATDTDRDFDDNTRRAGWFRSPNRSGIDEGRRAPRSRLRN